MAMASKKINPNNNSPSLVDEILSTETDGVKDITEKNKTQNSPYTDTIFQMLIRDLKRERLLTRDEEISLGKKVFEKSTDAAEAKDMLVRGNIRLVISIAKKYVNALSFQYATELLNVTRIKKLLHVK